MHRPKDSAATNVINKSDIRNAIGIKGPAGSLAASLIMSVSGLNKINRIYPSFSKYSGTEFTAAAMKAFRISTDIRTEDLSNIPEKGPFIIVSNHPFGGWDGIVLYDTVARIRPDFRIFANYILSLIPNMKDCFLAVNPFTSKKGFNSFRGLKEGKTHLENGSCLGIFPAGEVSTYYGKKQPADKDWNGGIMKLVRNAGCTVIPVYFDGTNSKWFHFVGKIHPSLRTLNLANELIKRRGQTITMRIGKPVPAGEIAKFTNIEEMGAYLKNRVYALEGTAPSNNPVFNVSASQHPIVPPLPSTVLEQEINRLVPLFEVARYQCFLTDSRDIPGLMREIGRKREESFRQVGEGTGKELDTDRFDEYYKHLVLWDKDESKLVGAYRLGIGPEIMDKDGVEGFYTNTLFNFTPAFTEKLSQSIELGRSFVSVEYKKEALPLMLLIKGLLYTVIKYDNIKYLFGPASISSWIPKYYTSLLVYSMQYFVSVENKGLVSAKTPFEYNFLRTDLDVLLKGKTDNIDFLDKYLQRISNGYCRFPTLIKKYLKLNAQILTFNVDKEFNYCVDGMIFLDIDTVPRSEVLLLTKGSDNPEKLLERFTL